MKFREIFRFEVRCQLRQISTWIYLALLFGITVMLAAGADPLISSLNAPVNLATWSLAVGLLGLLVTAALFVDAGHRDVRWRMDPLIFTEPVGRRQYLAGRFLGALLVNALLLLAVPAGLLLSTLLPEVRSGLAGPFRVEAYLLPYVVFLLPNLLINAAVLFGVTVLSRRSLPGYLGALALLVAYLVTVNLSVGLESSTVLALADPTGAVAMAGQTDGWTPAEQNTRLIGLGGMLVWNRLLWAALAVLVLGMTWQRFRMEHAAPGRRRGERRAEGALQLPPDEAPRGARPTAGAVLTSGAVRPAGSCAVPATPRSFGAGTRARQVLAMARLGARQTALTRDFLLIAAGLFLLFLFMGFESLNDPMFGSPIRPVTRWVISGLTGQMIGILIALVTVFYAGELVWRERDATIQDLGDTRPVPDWVPFMGKFLALGLLLVVLQAVLMMSGMLLQALHGHFTIQPEVYIQALFGLRLTDYLLFAVLALVAHVLVNHKYFGHAAAMLLFMAIRSARRFGIEHNLLVYGSDPGWAYADLSGFDPFIGPVLWFKLYWAAWAVLLGVVALLAWVRGTEHGARARLRLARQRLTRRMTAAAAAAVLLVLTTGGFVFYNTNVLNEYRSDREANAVEAAYERRYKRFEHVPQPWLTAVRLAVEVHPAQGEVAVRGTYRLVNRTNQPIDSVHLSSFPYPELALHAIEFDRSADPVLEDARHGYRIYALAQPLQPGDSLRMDFDVGLSRRGFEHRELGSITTAVRTNGTYLEMMRLLPAIGYQRDLMELSGEAARREQGLPPRSTFRPIDDPRARRTPRSAPASDWIEFDAIVGTAHDEIAVLPGTLQRTWTEGDRRYFHYRADAPIMNSLSLMSARYAVHDARWNDVAIRVLHHPAHAFNVERMVDAVTAALAYYTEQYGPYPHTQFTMVEVAAAGNFGRAIPAGMVYTSTNPIAVGEEEEGGIDAASLIIAHEVAHQWWGHQVIGADVVGSQVLSETLSQYSAAKVVERTYGAAAAGAFLRTMQLSYLSGRGSHASPEVPLLLTGDHDYIHYRKGPVVMYALQDYIGEDRVHGALRRLVEEHAMAGAPYPTTRELEQELRAVTPDSLRYLLEDLLETITLWDLRAIRAEAEPTGTGEYRVRLDVAAAKLRSDSAGNDSEIAMNDLVEIGVFGEDGEVLYLRRHRIGSGPQTLTMVVPGQPVRAGIDPYHRLIARHRDGLLEGRFTDVGHAGSRGPPPGR